MTPSTGIIYVATGFSYIEEAFSNAKQSKLYSCPHPVTLVTDNVDLASQYNQFKTFDRILPHPEPTYSYRDKIVGLLNLPYSNTLFLDSDAFLVSSFQSFTEIPQLFDISACHSPVRHPPGWSDPDVPKFFSEINTGVLFLRRNRKVFSLLKRWLTLYDQLFLEYNQSWDQASFRSVIWDYCIRKNLNLNILPSEFNIRTTKPWIIGRGSVASVVHGRLPPVELSNFLNYINGDVDTFRTSSLWQNLYPFTEIRPRFDRTFN